MRMTTGGWICLLLLMSGVATATGAAAGMEGRWKVAGDGSCYFDETDDGPDQCSPEPGRWKVAGDGSCYFDETDDGPDQCVPLESTSVQAGSDDTVSETSVEGRNTVTIPVEGRHAIEVTRPSEASKTT